MLGNLFADSGHVAWDMFLAVIPVILAYAMLWLSRWRSKRLLRNILITLVALAWLDFLPNTCYLLTEWRHFFSVLDAQNLFLRAQADKTAFLQLCTLSAFYFLFSGFGVMTFALAVRPVERLAARKGATIWFWGVPFFTAMSVGVYLGLVLRFNSWEPLLIPQRIWQALVELGGRPALLAFIVVFGVFLWLLYEAADVWIDGLAERWSKLTGRRVHLGPRPD